MANRPDGMPQVIQMIAYEDAAAALDWLATAFGFRERTAWPARTGGSATPRWRWTTA
jgi:uncharacterized glyoxalase superfamily protein PhnB